MPGTLRLPERQAATSKHGAEQMLVQAGKEAKRCQAGCASVSPWGCGFQMVVMEDPLNREHLSRGSKQQCVSPVSLQGERAGVAASGAAAGGMGGVVGVNKPRLARTTFRQTL